MRNKLIVFLMAAVCLLLSPAGGFAAAPPRPAAAAPAAGVERPAAETGAAETGAAGEKEPSILPDASSETFLSAVWTIIIFVVMLIVLYPTAWKNVLAGLKKREERIRSDIAEAEAVRNRAEATLKEYNAKLASAEDSIRQMLANATAEGQKLATNIRLRAQSEAEEIKERATKEIEATRDAALREIYAQTAELATSVAEKIIRRTLNAQDQQDLVRQSLDQLQTVK